MCYQHKGFRRIFAGMQLAAVCAMAIALATAPMAHAQIQCAPAPAGTMVAWYPFDENTPGFAGPSGNLATGNAAVWDSSPLPTPDPGEVQGALDFHGDSYVDSPDSIVTNFGPAGVALCSGGNFATCQGDFSMDVWINLSAPLNGVATIVDKRNATPIGYSFFLYRNTNSSNDTYIGVQLGDSLGSTNYLSTHRNITANAWHLLAVTVDRLAKIHFYLDGNSVSSVSPTQTGTLVNSVPLRIGANGPANFSSPNFFTGKLDELEIFNRVLLAKEVKALWVAQTLGKCRGD